MSWSEKAEIATHVTPKYSWQQLSGEIEIKIELPQKVVKSQLKCQFKPNHIYVGLVGEDPIIDGPLAGVIIADESQWTIDDKTLFVTLTKANEQVTWTSIVKGEYELDPLSKDKDEKKMLLEKFQNTYDGFDFSGAEFSGDLKTDPKTFLENMRQGS